MFSGLILRRLQNSDSPIIPIIKAACTVFTKSGDKIGFAVCIFDTLPY